MSHGEEVLGPLSAVLLGPGLSEALLDADAAIDVVLDEGDLAGDLAQWPVGEQGKGVQSPVAAGVT